MTSPTRTQRRYDHRLRDLVRNTNSIDVAVRHGVPSSTARGWLAPRTTPVVTLQATNDDALRSQREVLALRRRVERLVALVRLLVVLLKVCGFSLAKVRSPDDASKTRLLQAIDQARAHFSLRLVLRIVGLSHTRYHAWNQKPSCGLVDRPSCPRTSPQQLTPDEIKVIHDMVTADEYRHVPTGKLACLTQKLGKVFASATTWRRLVRIHRWRRSRQRVYPAKPKIGIRATRANEIWHIDTTLIRLLDGTRAYLHAIIDNFSRRLLAWRVAGKFQPEVTAQLLLEAARQIPSATPIPSPSPTVLVDGGIENFNTAVDEVVQSGLLKRVLAQTEIQFSNSLIESWWRVLKHQWLYLNQLDCVATVQKLVAFYVEQHNTQLPHAAFAGQTPDQMYFGTGGDVPKQLQAARTAARQQRLAANRAQRCPNCSVPIPSDN